METMTDSQPEQSEMDAYYERSRRPLIRVPQSRIGRMGCYTLVILWFVVLMLPCAMIYFATGNALTIPHANVPEPAEHPLLRVQLIMEVDNRGFQVSRSRIQEESETELCVSSTVDYLLWQRQDDDLNVAFCQCYFRETPEDAWQFSGEQHLQACE